MNEYEKKINLAIHYIINNLDKKIDWRSISKECAISEYHFHRIFTSYMEETPGDFIQRKRLEQSVAFLTYNKNEVSITEIAHLCGYSSQSNFSKAFKLYFGVTPGDVLRGSDPKNSKIGKIKSKYGKDFKVQDLYPDSSFMRNNKSQFKEQFMNVKIKDMKKRNVIYMKSPQSYVESSIHHTWTQLIEKASYLPMKKEHFVTYGIAHDNPQVTPEDKCHYDACILLEDGVHPGNNFQTQIIPEGKYACFYYNGLTSDLVQFYLNIYKNWFPNSGYEPGNFPLIENYLNVEIGSPEIELEAQFLVK